MLAHQLGAKEPEQLLASVALEPPTPPAPVVVSTEDLAAMAPQPVPSPEPVAKPPQPDPARTEAMLLFKLRDRLHTVAYN